MDKVNRYNEKKKLNEIVRNILCYFTYLEFISLFEKGKVSKEDIDLVAELNMRININHPEGVKNIKGKEYLIMGKKFVEKKDLLAFFNSIFEL